MMGEGNGINLTTDSEALLQDFLPVWEHRGENQAQGHFSTLDNSSEVYKPQRGLKIGVIFVKSTKNHYITFLAQKT